MKHTDALAINIRTRLYKKGWTQKQLATKSGYSEHTISNICNGKYDNIGVLTLINVSTALEAKVSELLSE